MSNFYRQLCFSLRKHKCLKDNQQQRGKITMLSSVVNSLLKTLFQVSVKRQVKNCMHFNKIVNYMDIFKQKSLLQTFAISHFKYYPLPWMFRSRKTQYCYQQQTRKSIESYVCKICHATGFF